MEILDVVNEKDEVIGEAEIEKVFRDLLPHRIIHILIFNKKGEMALQLRSKYKPFCPGHWSTAVGGHVQKGESYLEGALRELAEELGEDYTENDLTKIGKSFYSDSRGNKMFLTIFRVDGIEGPFDFNREEVERVEFLSLKKIQTMVQNGEKFHPELLFLLKKYFDC